MRALRAQVLILLAVVCVSSQAAIRIVSPAETQLVGGSLTTIQWTSDTPLPPEFQEWEAFLSVDGGRYYAVRITPHLDRQLTTFTFVVPNVQTSDARILLRFGDEKREREFALPSRFSIRFDPAVRPQPARVTREAGESARPGARGVVAWVAGDRDGAHLQNVAQRTPSCSAPAVAAAPRFVADGAETTASFILAARLPATLKVTVSRPGTPRRFHRTTDRLLQTRRLNI